MSNRNQRKWCTAYAIDTDKLNARWIDYLRAVYDLHPAEEAGQEGIMDGDFVAVRVTDDGSLPGREWRPVVKDGLETWALVCTEGVGWVPDEYNLINIRFPLGLGEEGRLPIYSGAVDELLTGEVVNLADHIRTFGDRLETNFWLWYDCATQEQKPKDGWVTFKPTPEERAGISG